MEAATASEVFDGLSCNGCGAKLSVPHGQRTTRCPYCASPSVVQRPRGQVQDPTFTLGFVVTEQAARDRAKSWVKRAWFTPHGFSKADVSEIRGVYVPAYLYTAAAHVEYSASIGENYTVTETYTTTDAQGKSVTRTRTRVETEWRELTGRWSSYVRDIFVTASTGLHNAELEAVEPFDTRALRRYTPKLLSGWIAEDPSMTSTECQTMAQTEATQSVGARLAKHMPGDSHRSLKCRTQLVHEDLELMLLPVWILAVKYAEEAPLVRLVINGQTGKLTGDVPRSWPKIALTVVAVLAAIGAMIWLGVRA